MFWIGVGLVWTLHVGWWRRQLIGLAPQPALPCILMYNIFDLTRLRDVFFFFLKKSLAKLGTGLARRLMRGWHRLVLQG